MESAASIETAPDEPKTLLEANRHYADLCGARYETRRIPGGIFAFFPGPPHYRGMQTRRDLFRLFGAAIAAPTSVALASVATPLETSGIAGAQVLADKFRWGLARELGRAPAVYDAADLELTVSSVAAPVEMGWECFVGRRRDNLAAVHRGRYIDENPLGGTYIDGMALVAALAMARVVWPARRFYRQPLRRGLDLYPHVAVPSCLHDPPLTHRADTIKPWGRKARR
jgi:hypothetical protein